MAKKYEKPQIMENGGGVAPTRGQKKRINPGPHKILQVGTNPNESEKTERIRTNPTLNFRVFVYFPHEKNESEFYPVCVHKYYIPANRVKFGFVFFVWKIHENAKFQGWICSDSFRFSDSFFSCGKYTKTRNKIICNCAIFTVGGTRLVC